jgi:hypothetical protein
LKFSPQRTRRKEDLTTKERKGFSFQISGVIALWTPLPRQGRHQALMTNIRAFVLLLESFRSLRKFSYELMLSCRIDKQIRRHHEAHEGHEGFSLLHSFELRALRVLRGAMFLPILVAASPRYDLRGERNQGDSPRLREGTRTGNHHG